MSLDPLKLDTALGVIIILLVIVMIYNHRRPQSQISNSEDEVDINDIIEKVEANLREGELKRREKKLERFFEVKSFDLELNFVAKSRSSQGGSIEGLKFIAVSAESEIASEHTQKLTLHMDVASSKVDLKPTDKPVDTGSGVQYTTPPPPGLNMASPSPKK